MTTATTLGTLIALAIHDSGQAELTAAQYLSIVNMAVDDLTAAGIVLPLEEDESLTITTSIYKYTVPASFAYIRELRQESAAASGLYPQVLHPSLYRLTIDGTNPVIYFDETQFTITNGLKLKIIGQKRPPQLVGGDTIQIGLESFLRERGVSIAAAYVGMGTSELAQHRRALSEVSWARSLDILARMPREWRPLPDAMTVPNR